MEKVWKKIVETLGKKLGKTANDILAEAVVFGGVKNGEILLYVSNKIIGKKVESEILPHLEKLIVDKTVEELSPIEKIKIEYKEPGKNFADSLLCSPNDSNYENDDYLNPKYTFETFVSSSSNEFAYAGCRAVALQPGRVYNPFFIYGGVGLGKTHLMQAIGHSCRNQHKGLKVKYVTSEQFTNEYISALGEGKMKNFHKKYRNIDVLLIDDIEFLAGKDRTQEEFFHTFNDLFQRNKQIVICSDRPPSRIQRLEDRLVNRFEKGLMVDIQSPDYELRMAILNRMADGSKLKLGSDVLKFMAENVTTSIRLLEGAFIRVMSYHSLLNKPIDVNMVEKVLQDIIRPGSKKVTAGLIQKMVAAHFHISLSDMASKSKQKKVAFPRQIAMYLTKELTDLSLAQIGDSFGGRDHSTVMYSCAKVTQLIMADNSFKGEIDSLIEKIREE